MMNMDGSGRVPGSFNRASRVQSSPLGTWGFSHPKNLWSGDLSCTIMLSMTKTNTSISTKEANYKTLSLDALI